MNYVISSLGYMTVYAYSADWPIPKAGHKYFKMYLNTKYFKLFLNTFLNTFQ